MNVNVSVRITTQYFDYRSFTLEKSSKFNIIYNCPFPELENSVFLDLVL